MSDYFSKMRSKKDEWMHDKLKKYVYPREAVIAYEATGDLQNSHQNEMDAKRHLIGTSLMHRNYPTFGPMLTKTKEFLPGLADTIGVPDKFLGEDYLMDRHNNEIADSIAKRQIIDPKTGRKRQMTEQEILQYIDQILAESRDSGSWRDGVDIKTGNKVPMWLYND